MGKHSSITNALVEINVDPVARVSLKDQFAIMARLLGVSPDHVIATLTAPDANSSRHIQSIIDGLLFDIDGTLSRIGLKFAGDVLYNAVYCER